MRGEGGGVVEVKQAVPDWLDYTGWTSDELP